MAPTLYGAPPGGVVVLSLSIQLWFRYSYVLVGGARAVKVACPLEVGDFGLEFCYLPLYVLRRCFQRHGVRLLGREAVGVQLHLLCEGSILRRQVGDGSAILRRGFYKIVKFHGHFHGVVHYACADVPPLLVGLLPFAQV